jgi:DNA-binding protein HU-beta
MTKQELAQKVAQDADLGSGDARKAVDAVFDAIASELQNGGEVAVSGFGKFSVSDRAAREGRNPATGETIQIPAKRVLKFRIAKQAKDSVLAKRTK